MTVIRGRVLDPEGRALSGARVYFRSGPGALPDVAGLTSEAGDFALAAPQPGLYVIESSADGFEPTAVTVDAFGADDVSVDVHLEVASVE